MFNKTVNFADYASGIRLPDGSKLAINLKNNDVTICRNRVIVQFFWLCFVSLVKFSYWYKFHVNIITGSGVMIILFYEGLTEIRKSKTPLSEFYPISMWRLRQIRDTKIYTDVCNEMLLNTTNYEGYSFYGLRVIKGKLTGSGDLG